MMNKEELRKAILDGIGRTNCIGAMDEEDVCNTILDAILEAEIGDYE